MAEEARKEVGQGPTIERMGFSEALTYLTESHAVKRAGWRPLDVLVLEEGILIFRASRRRVHSMPVGDILATDWELA